MSEYQSYRSEAIDREIAVVAGEPVDIERELVVSQLLGEHRRVEDEVLRRLFERAERAAAAEGRKARERAAVLQAAAVEGVWRWDELVRTFRSVPKQYLEVRDALFASAKDAVAILCFPRDLVADPVARYTDALLDGLLAGAGGREDAVARLRDLIERAADDDESFDRYQSPLAGLALDIAGRDGLAGKGRLRELLVDAAGCPWEAVELRNSRRAAVRVLGAETLLPRILSVIREHAGVLAPDPANAHKSHYGRHVRALAGIRELDARAAEEIVARWREVHSRRRSLWEALRAEDIDGLE